ncbi:MAG: hypothetical protein OEV52_04330 [Dehalococcoidia bacterium]|nr:hypothetical protein [Dehalococcoidia bacterium]MDH4291770.1 hypothetical protein [Dehalococcoidia bacterium]
MKKRIFGLILAVVMLLALMSFPVQAAEPEDIEDSIEAGIGWLASVQNADGSWGDYDYVGHTGLALIKLEDRAFELGYDSPFDPEYAYSANVTAGLNYLYSQAHIVPIGLQPAGDPDTNGNGEGISFYDGFYVSYSTGIALMALVGTRDPSIVVPALGSPIDGMALGDVVQDAVDFLAWSQGDSFSSEGGWGYGGYEDEGWADNSNSGYAVLGLDFAESAAYGFNANIPAFVKDELNIWIDYIQNDVDGDSDDGGSGYDWPGNWVNILKTGNLIYQMAFYGDSPAIQRVIDAVNYIERHWNDNNSDPGFRPAHYQSMFCVMKGLTRMGIDEITVDASPVDWFDEFSTIIVESQNLDGYWPFDYWGDEMLSTAWALLTLEKVAPPAEIEVSVDIKPMSWPNPLNVNEKGVLPVAILGTEDFDVTQIDPATILLEGVAPLRWALEDVGTAGDPLAGPDGFTDLSLKFDAQAIVAMLGPVNDGDVVVLHLTGNLKAEFDGTPIEGEDVVRIIKKK